MAEFEHPEELVKAAQRTTMPVSQNRRLFADAGEGLAEAIGFHRNAVSPLVLGAGLTVASRFRINVLDHHHCLRAQRGWTAHEQLAGVYPDHVRMHGIVRR